MADKKLRRVEINDDVYEKDPVTGVPMAHPRKRYGYFHGWGHARVKAKDRESGGVSVFTIALIELEDGKVCCPMPHYVRFLDEPA